MVRKISNSKSPRLRLALPATSANLGPAFDAAALAMDFYIKIDARAAAEFTIHATGRDPEICGNVEQHLILNTYREVLQSAGRPLLPLALKIANDIPIGKGCGSSAAARLAGIALAVHFGRLHWTDEKIVGEASRREDHADNASACWMGALTVARMCCEKEACAKAQVVRIRPKGIWPLLLAVPQQSLSTEIARRVLPEEYSRADVVSNVQNSMLLLAAFAQGRPDLLSTAVEDRIHQPYRAALCPLLPALQELKGTEGVLNAALSGAGPSVLIFLDPRSSLRKVRERVAAHLERSRLGAELISTSITSRGGRSSFLKF
ncbi:MAG TPA: homoserine kinase [Candidatus Sulfotelmatobacter sp.]|jgi:homoserine kinase|nr:homoserine kinase [Candidatus Sulfotelmatobacter sp.]